MNTKVSNMDSILGNNWLTYRHTISLPEWEYLLQELTHLFPWSDWKEHMWMNQTFHPGPLKNISNKLGSPVSPWCSIFSCVFHIFYNKKSISILCNVHHQAEHRALKVAFLAKDERTSFSQWNLLTHSKRGMCISLYNRYPVILPKQTQNLLRHDAL